MALRGAFRERFPGVLELKGRQIQFYLVPTDVHDITAACVAFEEQNDNDVQFYVSEKDYPVNTIFT